MAVAGDIESDYEYKVLAVEDYGLSEGVPIETAVEAGINANASDGWEFVRIDTVTSGNPQMIWAERKSVLIFRRSVARDDEPLLLTEPIFADQFSHSETQKAESPVARKPTIELAVQGARGGFASRSKPVGSLDAALAVRRNSGGRLNWRSPQQA